MKKRSVFVVLLIFFGFSAAFASNTETIYEYKLEYLRDSTSPKSVKLIRNRHDRRSTTIEKGVLFTYKRRKAEKVYISGDFNGWKRQPMRQSENGVWYFFLSEYEKLNSVRYKYIVDGIWTADPKNSYRIDDKAGSYISITNTEASKQINHVTYKIIEKNKSYIKVKFRIYQPKANYVAIIGDFNNWNPESDLLSRDNNNIWTIEKRIPRGIYRYRYVIDGKREVDLYNEHTASDPAGEICSLLNLN